MISAAIRKLEKWSQSEENPAVQDVLHQVFEVNLLWMDAQREFVVALKEYKRVFERVLEMEKRLDQARKQLVKQRSGRLWLFVRRVWYKISWLARGTEDWLGQVCVCVWYMYVWSGGHLAVVEQRRERAMFVWWRLHCVFAGMKIICLFLPVSSKPTKNGRNVVVSQ